MKNVYLLTLPESFASGIIGAQDLLRADDGTLALVDGGPEGPIVGFNTAMVGQRREMETTYGPTLTMDSLPHETGQADVVYIAPLAIPPASPPELAPEVRDWIRAQYEGGALVCAACTGTLALAASGLLDGQPATTHWAYAEAFRRTWPTVELRPGRTLIAGGHDKRLVTAGAHASWHDLMLYLIHRYGGAAAARRVAKVFLLDWHELDQNAYACFRGNFRHEDQPILDAQQWLGENLAHPDAVKALVARSSISPRSFQRRFRRATGHTPIRYIQNLRVEEAKHLLENTDDSVEAIGHRVGYEDTAYFRRLFRRVTGVTPAGYRKAFRTPADVADLLPQ